jgi:hypothetical protein
MLDFYIGQAGIPPDQFWKNTWRENALLGESWSINVNLHWEMHRFVSTMIVNTKATKRSQMITPDKLFPLPQDAFLDKGKPKSTTDQYQEFLQQIEKSQSKK